MNNQKLKEAFSEVRRYYPEVTMVALNKFGQAVYFDNDFNAPYFGDEIDMGILEKFADSVEVLPNIFHYEDQTK